MLTVEHATATAVCHLMMRLICLSISSLREVFASPEHPPSSVRCWKVCPSHARRDAAREAGFGDLAANVLSSHTRSTIRERILAKLALINALAARQRAKSSSPESKTAHTLNM